MLLQGKRAEIFCSHPNYAASVFLLSADSGLWERAKWHVADTGIYFDRIRLGGVTLEQYILFHAAKDVHNGTKHIRLSELADRELVADWLLRLIVNASVIEKCGVEIVRQEEGFDQIILNAYQDSVLSPVLNDDMPEEDIEQGECMDQEEAPGMSMMM